MTWNDLAARIAAMSPSQRNQPVRFVEPYDEGKAGYFPDVVIALEDIVVGESNAAEVFVGRGEPMLW